MSNTNQQLNPLQIKWLAALRSGKYKQGKYALKRVLPEEEGGTTFCCLGVLCDIVDSTKWTELNDAESGGVQIYNDGGALCPPESLLKTAGVGEELNDLVKANDILNANFAAIANALERYWKGEHLAISKLWELNKND